MSQTPKNRLEAIKRLKPPVTPKGCRSFAGMVNFVSMFCPELQKLLKLLKWSKNLSKEVSAVQN